jgi:hypothetical protein
LVLDGFNLALNDLLSRSTPKQQKQSQQYIAASKDIIEVAYIIQDVLEEFNTIKADLDAAYIAKDADSFSTQIDNVTALLNRIDFSNISRKIMRQRKWLKTVSELRAHIVKQLQCMKNARDGGAKALKQMRMSPKQLAAAKAASVRQKLAWGL